MVDRKKGERRGLHTISGRDLELQSRRRERTHGPAIVPEYWRPKTRGDCVSLPRPCPYVGCKYHLFVSPKGDALQLSAPSLEDMTETCALDVADRGPQPLGVVGELMGVTRERIRQIEEVALAKLRKREEEQ